MAQQHLDRLTALDASFLHQEGPSSHMHVGALCRPEGQLLRLAGRVFSQQLDRDRPLWEMWMVEGLEDGGFALLSKTHHAMIDGISGVDIAQVMFDLSPVPAEVDHPDAPWQPARSPSPAEVLAAGGP